MQAAGTAVSSRAMVRFSAQCCSPDQPILSCKDSASADECRLARVLEAGETTFWWCRLTAWAFSSGGWASPFFSQLPSCHQSSFPMYGCSSILETTSITYTSKSEPEKARGLAVQQFQLPPTLINDTNHGPNMIDTG